MPEGGKIYIAPAISAHTGETRCTCYGIIKIPGVWKQLVCNKFFYLLMIAA